MSAVCDYCSGEARLVFGDVIYPHRPDLFDKKFYYCKPCDAWVGCHARTEKPLGRLANKELRRFKQAAHAALDPLWQKRHERKSKADPGYKKGMARGGAYKRLAKKMGIPIKECHIGMFTVEQCKQVIEICESGKLYGEEEVPTESIDISVEVIRTTDAAVCINDGDKDAWIPKSQILSDHEFMWGTHIEITIPEWLAKDKGLL